MHRISDKLHLHRRNRHAAPLQAQDPIIKHTSAPINAQGQPIVQPLAPLPNSIPLSAQPSTLGKHPHGDIPNQRLQTTATMRQQPILHQATTQQAAVSHQTLFEQHWQEGLVQQQTYSVDVHRELMYKNLRVNRPAVYREPIIQEVVIPRIIEDIQPIHHRDLPQRVLERQEQHITENVSKPAIVTKQVFEDRITKPLPPLPTQTRSMAKPLPAVPAVRSVTAAPVIESRTRAAVIEQTSRQHVIQEIQPIIHREIDAPEVRLIEQHSYERVGPSGPASVTLAPVIHETLRPRHIEEIHPVIHRTVPQPYYERVEQHSTENITQPVKTTKQILNNNVNIHSTFESSAYTAPLAAQQFQQSAAPLATSIPVYTTNQTLNQTPIQSNLAPTMPLASNLPTQLLQKQGLPAGNLTQQGFAPLAANIPPAPPMPIKPQASPASLASSGAFLNEAGGFKNVSSNPIGLEKALQSRIPAPPPLPPKGYSTYRNQRGLQQGLNNFVSPLGSIPQSSTIPIAPPFKGYTSYRKQRELQQGLNNFASPLGSTPQSYNIPIAPPFKGYTSYRKQRDLQKAHNKLAGPLMGNALQSAPPLPPTDYSTYGLQQGNIPVPPPLPSKRLTSTSGRRYNPMKRTLRQQQPPATFISPMMRGSMPLQSTQFAPLASNIPPAPPLPTTKLSTQKLPQQQAVGKFQQAGGGFAL